MRLTITETVNSVVEVEVLITILEIADFDTGVGKIPLSLIEQEGDLLIGIAAAQADNLAPGDADDVLTMSAGRPAWAPPSGGLSSNQSCEGRLTLETGVPISTADQAAKTILYFTPNNGNRISLYSDSWERINFTEKSIKTTYAQYGVLTNDSTSVTGLTDTSQLIIGMEVTGTGIAGGTTIAAIPSSTSITLSANATASGNNELTFKIPANTVLDVFAFNNSGAAKLEFCKWTNITTRATALTTQDSIYVKTGAATRRYIGTICTTATAGQMEDSKARRLVWNYYNRISRKLLITEAVDSWTYATSNVFRSLNASDANRVAMVIGVNDAIVKFFAQVMASNTGNNSFGIGIALDATNANNADLLGGLRYQAADTEYQINALFEDFVGVGYHFLQIVEHSAGGTTTFYGDAGLPAYIVGGGMGWLKG
jgi:hypothetical protein